MDAAVIAHIGEQYQLGKISFANASLALIAEGCNASEVKILLDKYKPKPKQEEDRIR